MALSCKRLRQLLSRDEPNVANDRAVSDFDGNIECFMVGGGDSILSNEPWIEHPTLNSNKSLSSNFDLVYPYSARLMKNTSFRVVTAHQLTALIGAPRLDFAYVIDNIRGSSNDVILSSSRDSLRHPANAQHVQSAGGDVADNLNCSTSSRSDPPPLVTDGVPADRQNTEQEKPSSGNDNVCSRSSLVEFHRQLTNVSDSAETILPKRRATTENARDDSSVSLSSASSSNDVINEDVDADVINNNVTVNNSSNNNNNDPDEECKSCMQQGNKEADNNASDYEIVEHQNAAAATALCGGNETPATAADMLQRSTTAERNGYNVPLLRISSADNYSQPVDAVDPAVSNIAQTDVDTKTPVAPTRKLSKGEVVLVHCDASAVESFSQLCFTADGAAFLVPTQFLQPLNGNPTGQPWFYPLPLTDRQAALLLDSNTRQRGCYLVYQTPHDDDDGETISADDDYRLAVRVSADLVAHYRIRRGPHGDFAVEDDDRRRFVTVDELVGYFRGNRARLAARLRRPLANAGRPPIAGVDYDATYELDRAKVRLTSEIVARGEFGITWSAICQSRGSAVPRDRTSLGRVAVKVVRPAELENLEWGHCRGDIDDLEAADLIDELRLLICMNHCNVVRLVGVCTATRPYYLVTECNYDGTLKDCLRSGSMMPGGSGDRSLLLDVCVQTAAAVAYLHSFRFVLHRDLAARSFVVCFAANDVVERRRDGNGGGGGVCVKLAEFGRARWVAGDDVYCAEEDEPIAVKWAAPEILTELRYSSRSDVWALAVAWWEILSGRAVRPYPDLSTRQTIAYVTHGGRLPRNPQCPPDAYGVMTDCWSERPDNRPTASQLVDRLAAVQHASVTRRATMLRHQTADQIKMPSSRAVVQRTSSGAGSRQQLSTVLKSLLNPPSQEADKRRNESPSSSDGNLAESSPRREMAAGKTHKK